MFSVANTLSFWHQCKSSIAIFENPHSSQFSSNLSYCDTDTSPSNTSLIEHKSKMRYSVVYSIVLYIYQVNTISCFTLFATIYQHQESYKDVDFCIQNEQVEMKMPTEARTFPFSMIVGQKKIKEALVLLASNPRIGSVVISGENGTGKSVLAKAVHKILPQTIERVKDSFYNIDPTGKYGVDSSLVDELNEKDMELKDLEVEEVPTPFVQIPLNVMEDSLIGTVDLEKSLLAGRNIFLPGLLAKAHRGLLYVDDINLLDENIVDILFDVLSEGHVKVEKEGLSVQYPCVAMVVTTFNEQEGEIRDHLKDRIAISLSTDSVPLSVIDRVEAVDNYIKFSGDMDQRKEPITAQAIMEAEKEDSKIREKIVSARASVDLVEISYEQLLYLCEEATRAGCEGQRAEIFATFVAKANAAFHGRRKVVAEDLRIATILVIAPRAKFFAEEYTDLEDESVEMSDQQSVTDTTTPMTPSSPDEPQQTKEESEHSNDDENVNSDKGEDEEREKDDEQEEIEIPAEFMFQVTGVPLDPELLNFAHMTKKGKGGKSSRLFNLLRGHYVKPIFPVPGQQGRLAVGATLRAAAPYQRLRRSLAFGTKKEGKAVYIDKSDFRIKKMKKKAGALVIFIVDASGSMALNRMDAAKGAAIALLSEAYKARDKISLIVSRGNKADVLVPPTKSTALTKSRVESMPCGGGSPLAHSIVTAARVGENESKLKKDVGRVVVVIISDGRANIPLCISEGEKFDPLTMPSFDGRPTKQFLRDEVLSCAKQLGKLDYNIIVIDTEDKFVSTGIAKEIAVASFAKYFSIDARDTAAIRAVTKQSIA